MGQSKNVELIELWYYEVKRVTDADETENLIRESVQINEFLGSDWIRSNNHSYFELKHIYNRVYCKKECTSKFKILLELMILA